MIGVLLLAEIASEGHLSLKGYGLSGNELIFPNSSTLLKGPHHHKMSTSSTVNKFAANAKDPQAVIALTPAEILANKTRIVYTRPETQLPGKSYEYQRLPIWCRDDAGRNRPLLIISPKVFSFGVGAPKAEGGDQADDSQKHSVTMAVEPNTGHTQATQQYCEAWKYIHSVIARGIVEYGQQACDAPVTLEMVNMSLKLPFAKPRDKTTKKPKPDSKDVQYVKLLEFGKEKKVVHTIFSYSNRTAIPDPVTELKDCKCDVVVVIAVVGAYIKGLRMSIQTHAHQVIVYPRDMAPKAVDLGDLYDETPAPAPSSAAGSAPSTGGAGAASTSSAAPGAVFGEGPEEGTEEGTGSIDGDDPVPEVQVAPVAPPAPAPRPASRAAPAPVAPAPPATAPAAGRAPVRRTTTVPAPKPV